MRLFSTLVRIILLLAASDISSAQSVRGLIVNKESASAGYTLIAPFGGNETFLIDLEGRVAHTWRMNRKPSQAAYLLQDGSLLRTTKIANEFFSVKGGPAGGIQKLTWDGELVWDYTVSSHLIHSHHDIEPMPNGNVLVVAWERKSLDEALSAGRDPDKLSDGELWSEVVLEIRPVGSDGGEVVWEWHLWDHLVQSFDSSKENFGQPFRHPELIDLNFIDRPIADWIHMNSVDYNPVTDQIMLCGRTFDEVWVIDHGTTTAEASGHTGGRYNKGGDLLYRWGNPFTYFAGSPFDQKLFGQHDPHWIPEGLPGAGNILLFNNGSDRDQRPFSTVDEFALPELNENGFQRNGNSAFGPDKLTWRYQDKASLYSQRVSGAQRLPNGNTLICSGETGRVFEVTAEREIVWEYRNVLGGAMTESSKPSANGPLKGVAMFRATRYPLNYPAFRNNPSLAAPDTEE